MLEFHCRCMPAFAVFESWFCKMWCGAWAAAMDGSYVSTPIDIDFGALGLWRRTIFGGGTDFGESEAEVVACESVEEIGS